jgi:hypothetical protein
MDRSPSLHLCAAFAAAAATALLAGCATLGETKAAEEVVKARSQQRWNALIKREWSAAYPFHTPAYRALVTLDRYSSQFTSPVRWEAARPDSVLCEEKRCTVRVEVAFRLSLPQIRGGRSKSFIEETWVLEEGQWYYVERP